MKWERRQLGWAELSNKLCGRSLRDRNIFEVKKTTSSSLIEKMTRESVFSLWKTNWIIHHSQYLNRGPIPRFYDPNDISEKDLRRLPSVHDNYHISSGVEPALSARSQQGSSGVYSSRSQHSNIGSARVHPGVASEEPIGTTGPISIPQSQYEQQLTCGGRLQGVPGSTRDSARINNTIHTSMLQHDSATHLPETPTMVGSARHRVRGGTKGTSPCGARDPNSSRAVTDAPRDAEKQDSTSQPGSARPSIRNQEEFSSGSARLQGADSLCTRGEVQPGSARPEGQQESGSARSRLQDSNGVIPDGQLHMEYYEPPSYHESRYVAYRAKVKNIAGSQLQAPFASDYAEPQGISGCAQGMIGRLWA